MKAQPWIHSPKVDLFFILSPPLLAVLGVWVFREALDGTDAIPLWAWVSFILCIDVAHVYSTLFRTYLDPKELAARPVLFMMVPLFCWLGGILLYSVDPLVFWRGLAYMAVFHFIRQQYGFVRLYSRKEGPRAAWLDTTMIYLSALYPMIYWHTHLPRNFHWFVDGDFVQISIGWLEPAVRNLYFAIALAFVGKEAIYFWKTRTISLPKLALIAGTALSWYVGIIALNGDMAFTITNVVSHGIPYLALIWIYGRRQSERKGIFFVSRLPLFLGALLLLAFLEEGLWNCLVWREHLSFFHLFSLIPHVTDKSTLTWLVPLLSLPQATHYILDGFIWKLQGKSAEWRWVVFRTEASAI